MQNSENDDRDEFGRSLANQIPWKEAKTLEEACELTAKWLEGGLAFHPGYADASPANETGPIATDLVKLNRAGLMTVESQPGVPRRDGSAQRQYVDGFCSDETALLLEQVSCFTELVVITHPPGTSSEAQISVTLDNDRPVSVLGRHGPPEKHWVNQANEELAGVLSGCWSVQAFDPLWGRNDRLLSVLLTALVP